MKKFILFAAVFSFLFISCVKPENEEDTGAVPMVETVSLTDNAVDVNTDIGTISIQYDIPVSVADAGKISLTGMEITATATNLKLNIVFGTLEYGKEYVLTVGEGAVVSKSGNAAAPELVLSFKTMDNPNPPYTPETPGDYSQTLVTENPIPNASRLYSYMLSIYGKNTLSGAMANVDWNLDEAEWICKWTGKYPAIATFDFIHLSDSPSNWIDYGDITPARTWFEAGGIVSAGWHWNVPVSQGSSDLSYDPAVTSFSASEAVKDGTWENEVVKADLTKLAGYLKLLQNEGIPVLWRPLHEAAGNTYTQWHSGAWFWWGADGARAFKDLWIYVFEFLKNEGVRNLIWVWTTQTSEYSDADYSYYPGDEYVDIVGRDIYNLTDAASAASQFNTIAGMIPHKMVALSECGNVAGIGDMWNTGAKWLYFMPWYDYDNDGSKNFAHDHADISWWTAAFTSSGIIDRSELPSDLYE